MLYRFLGTVPANISPGMVFQLPLAVLQVGDSVYAINNEGKIVWEFEEGKFRSERYQLRQRFTPAPSREEFSSKKEAVDKAVEILARAQRPLEEQ